MCALASMGAPECFGDYYIEGTPVTISSGNTADANIYVGTSNGTGSLTVNGGVLTASEGVWVGQTGTGSLTINGGLVSADYGQVGYYSDTGAYGTVTVTGGTLALTNSLLIGNQGTGTLVISGGLVSATNASVGTNLGSGTATMTGGTWAIGDTLYLGYQSNGVLTLDGGLISASNAQIGCESSSNATATITSGTLAISDTLTVGIGDGSNGTLLINGGLVSSSNAYIANSNGSTGKVTVTSGTWTNADTLTVGNNGGAGTLEIDGGLVSSSNGYIGGGNGTATVTSGTWANSGDLIVGYNGTGTLLLNGGLVSSRNGVIGTTWSTGTATVTSGTWAVTNSIEVGQYGNGTLLINGGLVSASNVKIGIGYDTSGTATITSGTLAVLGTLGVGQDGTGTLLIDGGFVSSSNAIISNGSQSTGTVTVTSGTWANADSIFISTSSSGPGVLVVNGGLVTSSNSYIGNGTATVTSGTWANTGELYVGYPDSHGTVLIDGGLVTSNNGYLGYQWCNGTVTVTSGTWANTGNLIIGLYGSTGTLLIDGGLLSSSNSYIEGYSTATVASGTWANTGDLFIGSSGNATLLIDGGLVSSSNGVIASDAGTGTATVTSGTWNIGESLVVGYSGNGTLNINGTGVINVAGGSGVVALATGTDAVGTINFGTSATDTVGTLNATAIVGGSGTALVNFNHAGSFTLGLSLQGTLSVEQQNGLTILTTTNTYTGLTTVTSGTLQIGNGGTTGSITSDVLNNSVLAFDRADSVTYSGVLSGTGELIQNGSGDLILTGNNDAYAGTSTVKNGILTINSELGGDVTVTGGVLNGSGIIGGSVYNQSIISPGSSGSPATLTIDGNFTQYSSGTLGIQIASASQYSQLAVGGTATLGGVVSVSILNNYVIQTGDTFEILTASAISGTFSGLTGVSHLALNYETDSVWLLATQTQTLLAEIRGLTPNQLAVARALDRISSDSSLSGLVSYLGAVSTSELPHNLEKIVPTDLLPMFDAVIAANQTQGINLERRMGDLQNGATGYNTSGLSLSDARGTRSFNGSAEGKQSIDKNGKDLGAAPVSDRLGFFINGSGEFVDEESSSIARGTDFDTDGVTAGADYRLGDHAAIGLAAGYANTTSNGDGWTRKAVKLDSGKLAAYATVFDGGFFLNSSVGGGLNNYDTKRNTLGGSARGSTDGSDFNALLGTGYTYRKGGLSTGPVASLRYDSVSINGFTEHNSLAPLRYGDQSEDSLKSTLGWQASYTLPVGKSALTPQLRAQWQHQYLASARGIGASFLPGGDFTVYGPAIDRDSLLVDAGANLQLTPVVGFYAFYTGNLSSDYTSHAINGGLQLSF
ncbi:MAG: autotransporter domain-containing protein [Chthoniobacteraceae bacterium]